jgi:hypothetical protein
MVSLLFRVVVVSGFDALGLGRRLFCGGSLSGFGGLGGLGLLDGFGRFGLDHFGLFDGNEDFDNQLDFDFFLFGGRLGGLDLDLGIFKGNVRNEIAVGLAVHYGIVLIKKMIEKKKKA